MTQHLCRWYVDMGEDFKPLCKWKHMSPANCKSCPAYQRLLEDENEKLRELVRNLYKRFHGVVFENWSYSTEDFDMLACCMRELGVEVDE